MRYHAPCHLARRLQIDAPRQILTRLADVVEDLTPAGEDGLCCGAGGLVPQTDAPLARAMAHEAMAEVDESIPTVSGCPTCGYHLTQSGHPVRDLLDVLCEAMG